MKLFLISQDKNQGYDTYDSAVVIAENEEQAKNIRIDDYSWPDPEFVKVEYLGEAVEGLKAERWFVPNHPANKYVICASFNAG